MKSLTATEVARNFSQVLDDLEESHEEVVIVRNHRMIARIIPEPEEQNALEVLGDLYRTLDDETADALAEAMRLDREGNAGTLTELRDPWDS
ncbi:type II toxin-antitoxin system Phd/YefM family antitoxin [Haloferula sp. BvORR071]|uniref:type II toxin-antitoxin system Phd/YefM family antitoxin n=1 Tax=Haloferula sp. BvORR071 TaxID=1396141 RepID=UPI00054D5E8E|nr:type II toxin-antitoxin system Phd/YefM family antitoxin [Haloferula sp. BvORR071]